MIGKLKRKLLTDKKLNKAAWNAAKDECKCPDKMPDKACGSVNCRYFSLNIFPIIKQ